MIRLFLAICVLTTPLFSIADSPLSEPSPWRTCDYTISYCAYLHPTEGTSVFELAGPFETELLYKIPQWHRSAFLSPDGVYFISGYWGLNLVPLDVTEQEIMLTIWKNGEVSNEITLGQILKSMSSLERTSSHYNWGVIEQVTPYAVHLTTVEGSVSIELKTGKVLRRYASVKHKC